MPNRQLGFFFDQSRCTGCYACVVACKDWNDVPPGPASWMRVVAREWGQFPKVCISHLVLPCFHCAQPSCLSACPTEAIAKRSEDGAMVVDREKCLPDCSACLAACPYGAPQFGADGRMQLCTLCPDRRAQGFKPACVDACPMRALDAGPMSALRAHYGDIRSAPGFPDPELTLPSIVFRPAGGHQNQEGKE